MPFEKMPGVELEVDHFEASVQEAMVGPGTFNRPQTLIRTTQAWNVVVRWDEIGLASGTIHGNWIVNAYLESIGAGPEFNVGSASNPLAPGPHSVAIPVGAGTPSLAAGESQTPFKLVVTLTAEDHAGHRYPMAGYIEGPILQFYQTP